MNGSIANATSDSGSRLADPHSITRPCSHCGLPTRIDVNKAVSAAASEPDATATAASNADTTTSTTTGKTQGTTRVAVPDKVFCCHGCLGAYALIHELGLDQYYELRKVSHVDAASPVRPTRGAQVLQDLEAAGVEVQHTSDGQCTVRLAVDGLHCAACAWLIESLPPTMPGVHSTRVRMSDRSIQIVYDPRQTNPANVADRLATLGYALSPFVEDDEASAEDRRLQKEHWIGIASAFFLAANAMWIGVALYAGESTGMAASHEYFLRWTGTLLACLSTAFPGRIFFRSAWMALQSRIPHIDVPVALALGIGTIGSIIGAYLGRGHIYFDSLASLVLLLRIGRYIQFRSQYRTGLSVSRLLRMNTSTATRIKADGTQQLVPASRLCVDDRIAVLSGEMIPADGIILSGQSTLQTALLTGESFPTSVAVGDKVYGGTLNITAPIEVLVSAAGSKSRVGRLTEMVRQASNDRTPLIQKADKIGSWFIIAVLSLSAITFTTWLFVSGAERATQHTVALLTIACPCALAIAAPIVVTVALGRAARRQIWIRDGNCLERLAAPGFMWFDKTGTLTHGVLGIKRWVGPDWALAPIAALESQSNHPIAHSIVSFCREHLLDSQNESDTTEVEQLFGQGIRGIVNGQSIAIGSARMMRSMDIDVPIAATTSKQSLDHIVYVSVGGKSVGWFELIDSTRADAIPVLRELGKQGWKIGILSGDRQEVVQQLADELSSAGVVVQVAYGEMSPEQKVESITQSRSQTAGPVVMVGDGINDAAALAVADVGIALRGGSEISLKNAPVYIADSNLASIPDLIEASKRSVRAIYKCFAASLIYNCITISLAAFGWIHPLVAAILMPVSGITVLTLAMRARTFPRRKSDRS